VTARPNATRFAEALVTLELPALPVQRRAETVRFIERRMGSLPEPVALGVSAAAASVNVACRIGGSDRVARLLARRPLPVLGDYARLVRSLAFAFVWETWPDTRPDGAPQ
jgi:hypothetical protein